jgi:hypothetical protein
MVKKCKNERPRTNDDMIENLPLETPKGYTFTFTIYNLYNLYITASVPLESSGRISG